MATNTINKITKVTKITKAEQEKVMSKHFGHLWVRGDWELKRGKLRVNLGDDTRYAGESFIIDKDVVLEALKKANFTFIAEKKRVYKHLRLATKEDI